MILAFIFWHQHHALFKETIVLAIQNPINLNSKMGSFTKAAVVPDLYHLKKREKYYLHFLWLNLCVQFCFFAFQIAVDSYFNMTR